MTVRESAEYLGVSEALIRQWIWQRKIETIRIGRAVRISQSALDAIIERGTTPALDRSAA